MNQVLIVGRIKGEIIHYVQTNGQEASKFKVEIESQKKRSNIIDCVAWKSISEIIKDNIRENDLVAITGKLSLRSIQVNNVVVPRIEIMVDRINLIVSEHEITNFIFE